MFRNNRPQSSNIQQKTAITKGFSHQTAGISEGSNTWNTRSFRSVELYSMCIN